MAAKNKNLSSFDSWKKRTGKQENEILDSDGNAMSSIEQAALITHYLQLRNSKIEIPYVAQAKKILSVWLGEDVKQNANDFVGASEPDNSYQEYLFPELFRAPFQGPENPQFSFIDLFAGIGGFRMAFQNLGGRCVFSSEWDEQARKTYYANYGDVPFGDITKEATKNCIPKDFDVLCAGFPCQAFSLAGKKRGFAETRGTLFFDVAEILRRYQPKAFFL